MKTSTFALAAALLASTTLPGCAAHVDASLQRDTALAIGGPPISPNTIAISDVQTGTVCYTDCPAKWKATLPDGTRYDCTAPPSDAVDGKTVCVRHH